MQLTDILSLSFSILYGIVYHLRFLSLSHTPRSSPPSLGSID